MDKFRIPGCRAAAICSVSGGDEYGKLCIEWSKRMWNMISDEHHSDSINSKPRFSTSELITSKHDEVNNNESLHLPLHLRVIQRPNYKQHNRDVVFVTRCYCYHWKLLLLLLLLYYNGCHLCARKTFSKCTGA